MGDLSSLKVRNFGNIVPQGITHHVVPFLGVGLDSFFVNGSEIEIGEVIYRHPKYLTYLVVNLIYKSLKPSLGFKLRF